MNGINRASLAHTYLRGRGIEIGALHRPLPLSPGAVVQYVDRLPNAGLRKHYPELDSEKLVDVDIVDDGEILSLIPDASQDFVIANHLLEHCEDPIGACMAFFRVCKPCGIVYMAIPDKRHSFDRNRHVTPLSHLIEDHLFGPHQSREAHYREWVRLVENLSDPLQAQAQFDHLTRIGYRIHFHVWTQREMFELITYLQSTIAFEVMAFLAQDNECIFICAKAAP